MLPPIIGDTSINIYGLDIHLWFITLQVGSPSERRPRRKDRCVRLGRAAPMPHPLVDGEAPPSARQRRAAPPTSPARRPESARSQHRPWRCRSQASRVSGNAVHPVTAGRARVPAPPPPRRNAATHTPCGCRCRLGIGGEHLRALADAASRESSGVTVRAIVGIAGNATPPDALDELDRLPRLTPRIVADGLARTLHRR